MHRRGLPRWRILNLLRSPTGRAFVAIRDSEISAQSMGIHLARYKTLSFALSAALAGIGGALYAHKMQFISPDQFSILQSIDLLLMVVIGGLGSVHGAFLGAIFLITHAAADRAGQGLPAAGHRPGARPAGAWSTALVLIAFVLFEPLGLYGRWLKVRTYLQLFPFYRKGMFKRQKSLPEIGPAEMSDDILLSAKNLSVRFGGVLAVNNVSFDVQRGEVFTLIGPNGAGKTTVFNLISRIYTPTAGSIDFEGTAAHRAAAARASPRWASRAPSRTSSCSSTPRVLQNLLIGRHTHRSTGLWSDLFFTGKARARRDRGAREGRAGHRLPRPAAPPRLAWSPACPTACARWSSWRARCAPSPSCCCWTSRRRA